MTILAERITLHQRDVRSVNVERDVLQTGPLEGYVPSDQVVHGVRRFVAAAIDEPATRAWSLTGPYGVGKSSFAHFLCALYSPVAANRFETALKRLRLVDVDVAELVDRSRKRLAIHRRGMISAVAVAQREPVGLAVTRALHRGATTYWSGPGRKPRLLAELARRCDENKGQDHRFVLRAVDELAELAPVLLVLDELGKCLEFASDRSQEGDLFLLQQLAERFSGSQRMDGAVLGLQHLAFEDYAAGLSAQRRREWRKVQGRFEDIALTGSLDHATNLVAQTLEQVGSKQWHASVKATSRAAAQELKRATPGLTIPDALAKQPERCYPLHPLSVSMLPLLAERLGQHERSLVAFLVGSTPEALPEFLRTTPIDDNKLPLVRLDHLYDFFVDGALSTAGSADQGSLLREIQGRVGDAAARSGLELCCLKTIAVLNLVASGGPWRASRELVTTAVGGPEPAEISPADVQDAIDRLSDAGLVTFRDFAEEYRVWQGSDFDLPKAVDEQRQRLSDGTGVATIDVKQLKSVRPPRPQVARRHSQQTGTLRFFEARYVLEPATEPPTCSLGDADGLMLFTFAPAQKGQRFPKETLEGKPLVHVLTPYIADVAEAALDAAAASAVLDNSPDLDHDPVARREIRHRAAVSRGALEERLEAAFEPGRERVVFAARGRRARVRRFADLSQLLSDLCDEAYPRTPLISNEMINRRELTSQGAKSRRLLLEAMLGSGSNVRVGIEGWGPEASMYEALLAAPGIHAERDGVLAFGPPRAESGLLEAWYGIEAFFDSATDAPASVDRLYAQLQAPPYGMKEGAIPVLLTAALLHRSDDVFVYQDGSFVPVVTADLVERLLKTPERFAIKTIRVDAIRAAVFEGLRGELLGQNSATDRSGRRNATTLTIVRPLIALLRQLPEFVIQTKRISQRAQHIRDALSTAREPDELLFSELPKACGVDPLQLANSSGTEPATLYVRELREGLSELERAYADLLSKVTSLFSQAFASTGDAPAVREDLRSRSRHLVDRVIDRELRAFLLMAVDTTLDDRDWVEAMAMNLRGKPPQSWTDADLMQFEVALAERASRFRRLELLHLEAAPASRQGFEARRITLTSPDGLERNELIWVDEAAAPAMASVLDDIVEQAERTTRDGARALLALLADRVLEAGGNIQEETQPTDMRKVS